VGAGILIHQYLIHKYNIIRKLFSNDLSILLGQLIGFSISHAVLYLLVIYDMPFWLTILPSLCIACIYSYNTSIAKAIMSKLLPPNKRGEFMAFYSSFTYASIAILSGLYSLFQTDALESLGGYKTLPMLLFVWIAPGYLFLFILWRQMSIKRELCSSAT